MGVERNIIDKYNKTNPGDLYRPPALRSHGNETIRRNVAESCELNTNDTSNISTKEITSSTSSTAATTITTTTTTSISCNNSPIHRNENVNINNITTSSQQTSIHKIQQQQQHVEEQQKQPQRQQLQQQTRRERRPDRAVYIPRARRSQTTPPNTATTQIQQPPPSPQQQQQTQLALSTQLPVLAPITTSDTSKSLSQQLAITLDDTTTASVNQKPSSKADEVGKINISGGVVSTCSNNNISTTITKKKEKLNKENKESREQRREQRLLRKLLSTSTTNQNTQNHISKNNEKLNENSINTISNKDAGDESTNQAVIVNAQQILYSSSEINDVNNFSEFNNKNIINLPKGFNCDKSEELQLNHQALNNSQVQQEYKISSVNSITNNELKSFQEHEINNIAIVNNSILNESESQFANKPVLNKSVDINCETTTNINSPANDITTTNIIIENSNSNTMPKPSNKNKSNKLNSEVFNNTTNLPNLRIEDIASQQSPAKKCDIEEQELQRASKEINRSNRRIIKQTFVSDVLQIPDHINEEENEDKSKISKVNNKLATNVPRTTAQSIDSNTEEEEEDDWENMYNDSGDCLDPKIMQELTASVGKCKIELPKMDYSAYLTKQSILNEEEFPHVLEVSNFPVEFKNQDLLMVFSQYKESGFDIKWVDDTHALAVFSSSRIAAEVLTMGHPFVVLKPLAEATVESRLKAKKCAASLQPYRPRPETCAALARRLVTGALGVRLKTAAAERENEKRVLREAKERKLLAAKQRDEVWES
ncbi:formin-E [Lucilia sericata]|uniref:formin-E n=1 Tax=Lucilia sericata TaxID=13632 RepID=UPI0018A84320|nr:formin-E [Lucilia sericata]